MKLLLFLGFGLLACQQQKTTREVFLGFKLGSHIREVTERSDYLRKTLALKSFQGINYYSHKVQNFLYTGIYFSTPAFTVAPGDSLVSKVSVIFFDDLKYAEYITAQINSPDIQMYLSTKEENKLPASFVRDDVLSDLVTKYGEPLKENSFGVVPEWIYKWNDKNGVNIRLTFNVWDAQEVKMSGLKLEFTFVESVHKKMFPAKTVY